MLRLIVANLLLQAALAVSSPEIASSKPKSSAGQVNPKSASEQLANSLNVVAANYDGNSYSFQPSSPHLKSYAYSGQLFQYPNQQGGKPQTADNEPLLETDFQPMQPSGRSAPTPVIMQYLPHSQLSGGVQYLQLIPTRPLIVPISPYLTHQMSQAPHAAAYQSAGLGHGFDGRAPIAGAASERAPANALPYSLPAAGYGPPSSVPSPYGQYRSSREYDMLESPSNMHLNMNEYFPAPNEKTSRVVTGRP